MIPGIVVCFHRRRGWGPRHRRRDSGCTPYATIPVCKEGRKEGRRKYTSKHIGKRAINEQSDRHTYIHETETHNL